jgi:nicotinate dehydrogenase subunit B
MMLAAESTRSRADFRSAPAVLLVVRDPPAPPPPAKGQPAAVPANPLEGLEILLAVWADGSVTALNGHVDLGTGIRTALAQVVAEELDVPLSQVFMRLGDTGAVPNQGATIASSSLQIHAQPLRMAAAQARQWLLACASLALKQPKETLTLRAGRVSSSAEPEQSIGLGELVGTEHTELLLDPSTPLKSPEDYRVVGTSVPRVDIPAKAFGELAFVHDMRVPGMLHGRVVRPPYAGADHGDFIGNTLVSVNERSIAHIPGIRAVVVIRDFVGIVAEREEQAEQALRELQVHWKPWPGLPNTQDLAQAIRANPAIRRELVNEGDVDAAMAGVAEAMPRTYVWPYQMHASIGPSCAVADWQGQALTVWAGTQNPHVLRADLARLTGLADVAIDVVRMEAAGCYGRNGADDVAADAVLLSRAVGAPVRVQLTREQESLWEPKGAAQLMEVNGGLLADGSVAAYDFQTSYPSNGSPTLALLLTRTIEPVAQAFEMGDRTARPPYAFDNLRVAVNDMPPIVRASWLRGVSALPNSFAHESYIDELATAAGVDPVAYRLRYLQDPRAAELVQATADRAGWLTHTEPQQQQSDGDTLHGQGFAYARYIHSKWPGFGAAWAAWVADVEVNRKTGEVHVRRVVVGHDAGLMVNPAGVEHQVHGNVLQTTSRALKEQVTFEPHTNIVANREWGSYPILSFREVPVVEVMTMPRPGEPPLGAGESASVPGTAAIANAIFDATGVRFRQPPFTPEVVRAALNPLPAPASTPETADELKPVAPLPLAANLPANAPWPRARSRWAWAGALAAGAVGVLAGVLGWRPGIAPIAPIVQTSSASVYTATTIERGRLLAAAGDCVVCHTAPGGQANTGGRAMETPFGRLYTTNLTPDAATGIGQWSFSAFQRAMREGISRDGHHLYPAFPYTAFAKINDDDLQALYAYLMAQPAVHAPTPPSELRFPFSVRPLMAGWNAMFHDATPYQPQPAQSAEWNRGAYLVNGVGHCGACHTPRNAFGAELGGTAYLSGALVDGWEAPALTALSKAPVPWSTAELYRYLRDGHTQQHGVATGPMAPVVRELQALPDEDIRAMATYLGSFTTEPKDATLQAQQVVAQAAQQQSKLLGPGQRLFDGACSACHHDGDGPKLLGVNTPLALNTNLHSDRPDNLLRTILDGVQHPVTRDIGFMPAFRHNLSDAQRESLMVYMRQRFAPGKPAWQDLPASIARTRAAPMEP